MHTIYTFLRSLNGIFEPRKPLSHPIIADIYSSVFDNTYIGCDQDRINLKNDLVNFGEDFKKATKKAKEDMIIEQ